MLARIAGGMVPTADTALWGLILAGGDGTRLQALTRLITGQPIPKQYCRITGGQSLLEATLARVGRIVPRERILVIVNQDHLPVAGAQVAALSPRNVLVQPSNRDTGPGLAMALLALVRRDPRAMLAVFPSDHFVHREAAFTASVRRMAHVLAAAPDKIVLLGIRPDRPDPGLGYIVPADGAADLNRLGGLRVHGFEEKPPAARAAAIVRSGALWSSFIMLFRVQRMLEILRTARPREMAAMDDFVADPTACRAGYRELAAWNVSRDVLARRPDDLLVVRADDFGWSDWGTPEAIAQSIRSLGSTPPWLRAALARRGPEARARPETEAGAPTSEVT